MILFSILSLLRYRNDDSNDDKNPSWVNVPMFFFILFSFVPYGMTLHYNYKQVNPALRNETLSCSEVSLVLRLGKLSIAFAENR